MSFKEFQNGETRYELEQQRKNKLNELASLIREASRANIQNLLRLPDVIRVRSVDEVSNYRAMLKERLVQRLEDDEAIIDEDKQRIMRQMVEGIDEIDSITAKLDELKKKPGTGNDSGQDPDHGAGQVAHTA